MRVRLWFHFPPLLTIYVCGHVGDALLTSRRQIRIHRVLGGGVLAADHRELSAEQRRGVEFAVYRHLAVGGCV